jgi:hypothetical protein
MTIINTYNLGLACLKCHDVKTKVNENPSMGLSGGKGWNSHMDIVPQACLSLGSKLRCGPLLLLLQYEYYEAYEAGSFIATSRRFFTLL